MAIPTSRTRKKAEIRIEAEKCTACGLCVSVCKDFSLRIQDKKLVVADDPIFGCIACGHCMAICPEDAIQIHGRFLSPEDLFELPSPSDACSYGQVLSLLQRRRSVREFLDREVEPHLLEKILDAARTAPMGLPPSDVHVLVLENKDKTRAFAQDFYHYLEGMSWFVSRWFLALLRPFWGKTNDELFKAFVRPMFRTFISNMEQGVNLVNYDAPVALYFYATPYADPADPIVAATYAMLAAESLGLGTCMLGSVHPLIQSGRKARKFREKHGILHPSREGLFVILGHPSVKYTKGIKRTFASDTIQ